MNQYNSYYLYQQYEKRGNQDWLPSYPNIFSVDGDGTMPLVMKKQNDPDCGYTGDTQPIYRWYPLPITTDYICDECPVVQYRWENISITEDYVCVGTDKYYKQKRQYSYDSGTTWYDVTPPETQTGSLYQTGSTDCGYVPPIEPQYRTTSGTPYCEGYDKYVDIYSQVSYDGGITWSTTATTPTLVEQNSPDCGYVPPVTTYKFLASYSDSEDYHIDCDSSTELTSGETKAYGNYQNMTSAIIGDCVESLGNKAFYHCDSLTSVTIPNSVVAIGSYMNVNGGVFEYCTGLTSVVIPNSVTYIGSYAFARCSGMTSVNIPSSVTTIDHHAFCYCDGFTNVVIPDSVTSVSAQTFAYCAGLTGCTIGNGATAIGAYAFQYCTSLSSVTIGSGVTSIGDSAFQYCLNLASVIIPESVITLGEHAFFRCDNLTSCTIGSNVETIGNSAFARCGSMTSISIPSSVTSIGDYAFSNCSGLTGVTVNAATPPTLGYQSGIGTSVFNNTNNCPIYVPAASVNTYKSALYWRSYSSRIQAIP